MFLQLLVNAKSFASRSLQSKDMLLWPSASSGTARGTSVRVVSIFMIAYCSVLLGASLRFVIGAVRLSDEVKREP